MPKRVTAAGSGAAPGGPVTVTVWHPPRH